MMKSIVFLLFAYIGCICAITPWSGVAENVVYSDLINAGWTECYSSTYNDGSYPQSLYMTPCTQNTILLGCRPVGASALTVAAYSPRYVVFGETDASSSGLHIMNGVTWYFTENWSIGFSSPDEPIFRNECDTDDGDLKLCWHTLSNGIGGYRCGSTEEINHDTTWEKVILQTNLPEWGFADACIEDSDCNNYGVCVSTYEGKGCSCLSGFGGSRFCDTRPTSCSFSPVAVNGTNFLPSIDLSIASSQVTIAVSANLEQTKYDNPSQDDSLTSATAYSAETYIRFGTGSATPCDYPPSMESETWVRNSADVDCQDKWGLTLPWSSVVADCGFQDNGDHSYSQLVTVSRNYILPDLSGSATTRTEYVKKELVFVFPASVTVENSVNVTGPVAVTVNAIVSSSYDIGSDSWSVVLKTLTNNPYKLSAPSVSTITGEIASSSRYANSGGSITLSDVTACNNNNDKCTQTITLKFVGCDTLSGGVIITSTPVCSGAQGANCGAIDGTVSIGIHINNADSCAVVNNIDFSVKTLQSFSDSAITTPKTLFRASDIAYFGAVVQSTNATLTGFTVRSVCMTWGNSGCQSVTFNPLAASGSYNAAFSINLAQTRYFTTSTSLETFSVTATIDVTWANGKRDTQIARANIDAVVGIDLSEEVDATTGESATENSSASKISIIFAFVLLIVALL